jgi:GT2 family glycosyltransferase
MASNISFNAPVSTVIPTYNGKHLLAKFLPAVLNTLRNGDELVIVDDHSPDETVSWLVQSYNLKQDPNQQHTAAFSIHHGFHTSSKKKISLTLVANHHNVRFGQAANRGVQLSSHPYVFLLNSDVKPRLGVVEALLAHFEDPSVFGVGCFEVENDDPTSPRWGGKNELWFARGMFLHRRAKEFTTGETAWVSGGSGMFDKAKWQELGGFDAAYYPAYWEDIDLSFRAKQKGWQVLFDRQAEVEHHHETTNNDVFGQAKIDAMSWKNANVFTWKNASITQRLLHVFWKPYWWWKRRQVRPL